MPHSSIVILTGAGISAESGLRTFRDQIGLWENHRVEDVVTPEASLLGGGADSRMPCRGARRSWPRLQPSRPQVRRVTTSYRQEARAWICGRGRGTMPS